MKKKLFISIIYVLLFQLFVMPFGYVEAKNNEQPKVCNGPSEMMSNYFEFQTKMGKVLMGTDLNSKRFSASFTPGGLFTNRVLNLHTTSAIELFSSSVIGNLKSFVSNSITSMFLLELAAFSVIQSNTEGFAILFADWPIVRDYKTMLDIETNLFDIAYFRSMQIDLTREISEDSKKKIKDIIKEYQNKGLLTGENVSINGSMGDIILDLVQMNAVMKQFIMVGGENIGNAGLRKYNGCLGNLEKDECDKNVAVIRFSDNAIDQLSEDYIGVRGLFGGCNLYGNNIKGVLKKTVKNNSDSVSQAMQDVVDALGRLKSQLFNENFSINKKRWNFRDPCKDLSEYEMAQLQAYWGGNWKCGEGINLFTTKRYIKDKIAQIKQKKKRSDILKKSKKLNEKKNLNNDIKNSWNSSERAQKYINIIGTGNISKYYNFELGSGFLGVFEVTMNDYFQAQESAISTDVSSLFLEIRGVLDQVDEVNNHSQELNLLLKKLQGKQCSK